MNTNPSLKAVLSVNEFCHALCIGRTLFYERVGLGEIKILKVGTRNRSRSGPASAGVMVAIRELMRSSGIAQLRV